jgi:LacI family transcriptional regulator
MRTTAVTTIKEVARLAGVAPSSVTRVLNGHPHVSEDLSKRVLDAVAQLGYRPDLIAAGLRRGTSQTVGILLSDIINPSMTRLVDVLEADLRASGYGVLLANSHGDPAHDIESVELLRQRRMDGLVVICVDQRSTGLREALDRWGGPTVLIDRQIEGLDRASVVLSDHRRGSLRLTGHLLDLGHRRIGYLGGPIGSTHVSNARTDGFAKAFADRGLEHDESLIETARATAAYGRQATAALLDGPNPPTAIIIGPNPMLAGALLELRARGLRVGHDIALACLDDSDIAALHQPAITAVWRDISEVASTAADLLLAQMTGVSAQPRTTVLPVELQIRESTTGMARPTSPATGKRPAGNLSGDQASVPAAR